MLVCVPADWEVVRHAVSEARGKLVWVDRYDQRLELAWQACENRPHVEQLISDYRRRDLEADSESRFIELKGHLGWTGYRCESEDKPYTRAGRYERHLQRWVEMVIPWPGGDYDRELEAELLAGYSAALGPTARRRWMAFGLDVTAPQGWTLQRAAVRPGDATMRFTRGRGQATIRRLGMTNIWYDNRPDRWLTEQVGDEPVHLEAIRHQGKPAQRGTSREALKRWRGLAQLTGRLRERRDLVWAEPSLDVLIHICTLTSPRDSVDPSDFQVQALPSGAL